MYRQQRILDLMQSQSAQSAPQDNRLSVEEVKAQIMANCTTLWTILRAQKNQPSYNEYGRESEPRYHLRGSPKPPKLNLITTKRDIKTVKTVTADVVYETQPPRHAVMLRGPDAWTQREAYERLLAMTEEIIARKWNAFIDLGELTFVGGFGNGYYVAKH
ncbi:hypothetical protein CLAFUW4_03900 [Fulvia fulva]|uniref:Uncharacterized protein n=1 Tax=Passalora fulva TaxID=5499 RepID=A0A9Q8L9L8_PASFU|nr:uncharacterized protein CLAFUR5_03870 [Fulvia fulva]KAK4631403.1 hypothetical protein CLAFUR4_03888 [Fulvia fulva]KAK4632868.1 hypothetical protein CLAFUR0_03887 [Fulvia fulva]UJO13330.1 hypothetical protein CLAFUR5_03870 [Fulvia fulva]WPV11164.1 hypothetical protein CLAFUW4_03900 [Fulvia fulva]WPV26509.1 hypothetical protein CLAFUW7_03891 [Fulvia fulva]